MDERQGVTHRTHGSPGAPPLAAPAVSCALCGSTAPAPPLTWMYELDRAGAGRWYCQDCSRRHLRAVEARLDQEWW